MEALINIAKHVLLWFDVAVILSLVVLYQFAIRMYDVTAMADFVANNTVELSIVVLLSGIAGSFLWKSIPMKVVSVAVGFAAAYLLDRYYPVFTI